MIPRTSQLRRTNLDLTRGDFQRETSLGVQEMQGPDFLLTEEAAIACIGWPTMMKIGGYKGWIIPIRRA
jgi:hypothetical protein